MYYVFSFLLFCHLLIKVHYSLKPLICCESDLSSFTHHCVISNTYESPFFEHNRRKREGHALYNEDHALSSFKDAMHHKNHKSGLKSYICGRNKLFLHKLCKTFAVLFIAHFLSSEPLTVVTGYLLTCDWVEFLLHLHCSDQHVVFQALWNSILLRSNWFKWFRVSKSFIFPITSFRRHIACVSYGPL